MQDALLMPPSARQHLSQLQEKQGQESGTARVVADYIAGMTDRYAIAEYERLFNVNTLP
jgi:dGTPase